MVLRIVTYTAQTGALRPLSICNQAFAGAVCMYLIFNDMPGALQKAVFRIAKGGLLACKRRPFGRRKTVFGKFVCGGLFSVSL